MKVELKEFSITITKEGIKVVDKRHEPPVKCGKLSWQEIMDLIETEYSPPTINSRGL